MKHSLSIFLATVLLSLSLAVPDRAAESYSLIGDADEDGVVTILDATRIQRALASLDSLSVLQRYLADVDNVDGMTIIDATVIQRRLAEISDGFYSLRLEHWQTKILSVSAPLREAPLSAGDTMTFHIDEDSHPIPSEYDIFVDGIRLRERGSAAQFSYTFPTPGSYVISVVSYDPFGGTDLYREEHTVLSEADLKPMITSATYNRNTAILSVIASGGCAPYRYQYIIRNDIAALPPQGGYAAKIQPFTLSTDENGNYILICQFCDDSAVYIPTDYLTRTLTYTCEVQVRDRYGNLSAVKKVQIPL